MLRNLCWLVSCVPQPSTKTTPTVSISQHMMRSRRELFLAENGVIMPVSAKNNEMMYRGLVLGHRPFFCAMGEQMGLAACPRASFEWEDLGREWKALLRTCSANVPGTVWVGCRHRAYRPRCHRPPVSASKSLAEPTSVATRPNK